MALPSGRGAQPAGQGLPAPDSGSSPSAGGDCPQTTSATRTTATGKPVKRAMTAGKVLDTYSVWRMHYELEDMQ